MKSDAGAKMPNPFSQYPLSAYDPQLGSASMHAMGKGVGIDVGFTVGNFVGAGRGDFVEALLGASVGDTVGDSVGACVGDKVTHVLVGTLHRPFPQSLSCKQF